MCGVSTQQWPSTQITLFERTRQSAWFRRCDDTVDRKRVNSCVLKHLSGGSWATKKVAQKPGNALSDALLMSCFQNFAADVETWRCLKKGTAPRAVSKRFWLIRINSGPKILTSCCIHCTYTHKHTNTHSYAHNHTNTQTLSLFHTQLIDVAFITS